MVGGAKPCSIKPCWVVGMWYPVGGACILCGGMELKVEGGYILGGGYGLGDIVDGGATP